MGWWHNMRRRWLSVSAHLRFHQSGGGGGGGDGGGSGGGADTNGLLQLRDEVKKCSYKDVHVMWNILNGIDNIPTSEHPTTKRQSYLSWRVFHFWSNHKLAPCSSSFSASFS